MPTKDAPIKVSFVESIGSREARVRRGPVPSPSNPAEANLFFSMSMGFASISPASEQAPEHQSPEHF